VVQALYVGLHLADRKYSRSQALSSWRSGNGRPGSAIDLTRRAIARMVQAPFHFQFHLPGIPGHASLEESFKSTRKWTTLDQKRAKTPRCLSGPSVSAPPAREGEAPITLGIARMTEEGESRVFGRFACLLPCCFRALFQRSPCDLTFWLHGPSVSWPPVSW